MKRSVPAELPSANLQPAVKTAGQVNALVGEANVERELAPPVDAQMTAETLIYPQDQNLDIPPHEVILAFVRIVPIFPFLIPNL